MKFDMHCHTKEGSLDGKIRIGDYICSLKEKGFGGMLVSDHNSYNGYREWKKTIRGRKNTDFVVLKGVEYDTCDCGHMLVIMPSGVRLKVLELRGLPSAMLIRIVHAYGGILGPAHPYGEKFVSLITTSLGKEKYRKRMENLMPQFDFVEIFNACESRDSNRKAALLARRYQKPGFGGSDAHRKECIGYGYTELPETIRNENDLISYVKHVREIPCGGRYYARTARKRIGKFGKVLTDLYFVYNKTANRWRRKRRKRELSQILGQ